MPNMRAVGKILGMEIRQGHVQKKLFLSQKVLDRFGMLRAKSFSTPLTSSIHLPASNTT